jgi:hypothetical protein
MPAGLIQVNANLVRMWLALRGLRGLKFDTVAVPRGGDLSIRSRKPDFLQERCHDNLHLAWSFHFRCRQGHGG